MSDEDESAAGAAWAARLLNKAPPATAARGDAAALKILAANRSERSATASTGGKTRACTATEIAQMNQGGIRHRSMEGGIQIRRVA